MHDQRLVTRLENYWNLIRRGKELPDIAQLNPSGIDDMWQQCLKLEIRQSQGAATYLYQHMGDKLVPMFGRNLAGTVMDRRSSQYPYSIIAAKLEAVARTKAFTTDEGHFMSERGRAVKYRACWLPFGNDAKGVTHIIVGFSDREY